MYLFPYGTAESSSDRAHVAGQVFVCRYIGFLDFIQIRRTPYNILSKIVLSSFKPYEDEILGIIIMDFDVTDQLLIIHSSEYNINFH